jgi:hypothetical protein
MDDNFSSREDVIAQAAKRKVIRSRFYRTEHFDVRGFYVMERNGIKAVTI